MVKTSINAENPTVNTVRALVSRSVSIGGVGQHLHPDQVRDFVVAQFREADLDGKRVCLVVPDGTRTCPLPLLLQAAASASAAADARRRRRDAGTKCPRKVMISAAPGWGSACPAAQSPAAT